MVLVQLRYAAQAAVDAWSFSLNPMPSSGSNLQSEMRAARFCPAEWLRKVWRFRAPSPLHLYLHPSKRRRTISGEKHLMPPKFTPLLIAFLACTAFASDQAKPSATTSASAAAL